MIEPRVARYEWGQRVQASVDLFNDGSYPDCDDQALLVAQGTAGEVVQVGMHEETTIPVYLVEFPGNRVVGCLEEEIALLEA